MKKSLYIFLVLSLISGFAVAQNGNRTIIDDLNTSKWGQGNVKVMQDEAVQNVLGIRQTAAVIAPDTTKTIGAIDPAANFTKVKGFKIQVFSGNNQQRSKREAESKQAQVRTQFPELESVVSFVSPFWRLRVGNFLTREDANTMLKEMKKAFPGFGREMYVVDDVVKRPVH
ncbi:SPOR domain-containing protein [Prevotella sp. 10(H)]|uniref:SPOR domain-containing protein n=1 Tax=Prevotella sp. 10(H) TaxID=1158294 RepID=UPI0004A6D6E4|nr:SPOR domain-containing protein [Prevotella sp. 10(H)]